MMTDPVARRVGSAEMDQAIDPDVPIQYYHFPGSDVVVCLIMLRNGQPVTGECSNFLGHCSARMWPILGSKEPGYFNIKRTE